MITYLRTAATQPDDDELVIVALYHNANSNAGKFWAYAFCYWRGDRWESDCGDYVWPASQGLLWAYFTPAPRNSNEIAGHVLAQKIEQSNGRYIGLLNGGS